MKIFFRSLCILLFIYSLSSQASDQSLNASKQPQWLRSSYHRLKQIWQEGDIELYLTGYAWHNRYTYSADRIKTYNENAWGGGLGKSFLDEKGNRHDLYAFAFLESHKKVEPIAGYAYLKVFHISEVLKPGIGVTAFITARPDINHGVPFPGALPFASIILKNISLSATYIPGRKNIGNVLFLFAKYRFN